MSELLFTLLMIYIHTFVFFVFWWKKAQKWSVSQLWGPSPRGSELPWQPPGHFWANHSSKFIRTKFGISGVIFHISRVPRTPRTRGSRPIRSQGVKNDPGLCFWAIFGLKLAIFGPISLILVPLEREWSHLPKSDTFGKINPLTATPGWERC